MDVWRILVYIVAAVLAVRSLVSLMTLHRHNFRQEVLGEEKRLARELRRKRAKEEALATDPLQQALASAGTKRPENG